MAGPITFENLVGQAVANPLTICESVLTANPAEVGALAAAFQAAGASSSQTAECALAAQQMAEAAALIEDKTPVQLMGEVAATQSSLDVNTTELFFIGEALNEIASRIESTQAQLGGLIDTMYDAISTAAAMYECAATYEPASDAALHEQCAQSAIASIDTTAIQAKAIVNDYDAFLTQLLNALQTDYGYVTPTSLGDGSSLATSTAVATLIAGMPSATTPPSEAAAWWETRTDAEKVWLIDNQGGALAALHGVPAVVLNLVNRRELTDDASVVDAQVSALQAQQKSLLATLGVADAMDVFEHPETYASNPAAADELAALVPVLWALQHRQANIHGVQAGAKKTTVSDGTTHKTFLLEYDDVGATDDGEAVIAIDNPDEAVDLAISVPGTTSNAAEMTYHMGNGSDLYGEMEEAEPGTKKSVIVYLGMDVPDNLPTALLPTYADAAAPELAADVAGYTESNLAQTDEDPHVTVIGHSYGSLIVGEALHYADESPSSYSNLLVDDVVFVGSPGVGVNNVSELHMSGNHVFAELLPDDKVTLANDLFDFKAGSVGGSPDGAVFGKNVTRESFGATVLQTADGGGHGVYFDYGTTQLTNMAQVATGNYDQVTTEVIALEPILVPAGTPSADK